MDSEPFSQLELAVLEPAAGMRGEGVQHMEVLRQAENGNGIEIAVDDDGVIVSPIAVVEARAYRIAGGDLVSDVGVVGVERPHDDAVLDRPPKNRRNRAP